MKVNYAGVPITKVSQKKSWRKVLLENQEDFLGRLNKHDREMKKEIDKEVARQFGDKIDMIEAIYKRTIVIQNIWFDKGLITREEIGKKYEELKLKKKRKKNG